MYAGTFFKRYLNTGNLILLGVLVAGILLYVAASDYPEKARKFPQLVLLLAMFLSVFELGMNVWRSGKKAPSEDSSPSQTSDKGSKKGKILSSILLMVLFTVCLYVVGLTGGTFLFCAFSIWFLGYRNIKGLLFSTIMITILMYLLFTLVIQAYLPPGLIFELFQG